MILPLHEALKARVRAILAEQHGLGEDAGVTVAIDTPPNRTLGDLGTLFPPDDERWRDSDSFDLLRIAMGNLPGRPTGVDATLICEEPKLAPHRAEMEANLSEALSAPVSVKASTNEGMGAIGRGEGIACMAVVTVETG